MGEIESGGLGAEAIRSVQAETINRTQNAFLLLKYVFSLKKIS
jgi:hypothetical protein